MRRFLKAQSIYCMLFAAVGLSGCGSSGSNGDQTQGASSSAEAAPRYDVTITFPVDGSLTGGGESSFRVKGVVMSDAGASVALSGGEISVNGVAADIKEGGQWYADIPLVFGENSITATFTSGDIAANASITLDNGLIRSYMSERLFNGRVYGVSSGSLDLYVLEGGAPTLAGIPTALQELIAQCNRIGAFEPVTANQALVICDTTDSFYLEDAYTHIYSVNNDSVMDVNIPRFELSSAKVVFIADDVVARIEASSTLTVERLSTGETVLIEVEELASAEGEDRDFTQIFEASGTSGLLHLTTNRGSLITIDTDDLLLALQQDLESNPILYTEKTFFDFPFDVVVVGEWACHIDYFGAMDGTYPMICSNLVTGEERVTASSSVGTGPIWQAGIQSTGRNTSVTHGQISRLDDETIRVASLEGDGVFEVDIATLVRTELAPAGVAVGILHATDQQGQYLSYSVGKGIATHVNVSDFSIERVAAPAGRVDVENHGYPYTRALPSLSGESVLHLNNFSFTGTSEVGYPLITEVNLASDEVSTALFVEDIAQMLGHDLGAYRYRIVEIKAHPDNGYIIALAAISVEGVVAPFEGLYQLSESFDNLIPLNINENFVAGDTPEAQPLSSIDPATGRFVVSSFNDGSVSLLAPPYTERVELIPAGDPYRFVFYPLVDWERNRLVATGYPLRENSDTPDFGQPTIFSLDLTTQTMTEFSGRGLQLGFTEMSLVTELGLYHVKGSPYNLGPSLVLFDPDSGDSIIKPLTLK